MNGDVPPAIPVEMTFKELHYNQKIKVENLRKLLYIEEAVLKALEEKKSE